MSGTPPPVEGPAAETPTVDLSTLRQQAGPPPDRRATRWYRRFGRWTSGGMVGRTVLVTCAVALIAVLVTAVVAIPLARVAAERQQKRSLADQADLALALLNPHAGKPRAQRRLARQLGGHGVALALVMDGKPAKTWVPKQAVTAIGNGRQASLTFTRNGRRWLAEARALDAGNGVVLAQAVAPELSQQILQRLGIALLAGLAAGVIAGVLLARRLSRPIRRAAVAAHRIATGERSVRLPVAPPDEVAELSRALNGLTEALADSENRQREFLLSVSHELRTPLTTIRGYGEALADGVLAGSDPDAVRQAGDTVLAESARLDRLISDLLALARLSAQDFPVEIVDVDLTELAGAAVTAWGPRCVEAGVELRAAVPPRPVPVRTDPGRLRQVLDGLLENAFRVVPPGAPVVVAVGAEAGLGVLEVRDGGPGLSDEDIAVAFERGRLYQKYQGVRPVGTGLGLALAARLVHRLGGRIEAGHAAEGGARFTVRLPAGSYPPRTSS